jgi:hypothetical protein
MEKFLLQELRSRRATVRREWITLLRAEPVATPLGHPDTLAHLIDRTLDEVFTELARRRPHAPDAAPTSYEEVRRACACGRNPLLVYFLAGERALLESLVQAQAEQPVRAPERHQADVVELYLALRGTALREVAAFCSVCVNASSSRTASPS